MSKLYGRESELETLMDWFETAKQGQARTILLSGAAGCGKTALVEAFQTSLPEQASLSIAGKFEPHSCVPYAAFIQAFRNLLLRFQVDAESAADSVVDWRQKLLSALGQNGQLLIDILPELEALIGPQPPVLTLAPVEAKNRFNRVLQKFIAACSLPERPLVLCLDDLHWADPDSLELFQRLANDPEMPSLLPILLPRPQEKTENLNRTVTHNCCKFLARKREVKPNQHTYEQQVRQKSQRLRGTACSKSTMREPSTRSAGLADIATLASARCVFKT